MYTVFVILHILNCAVLCVVVLLQASKGGGLAGAFGGGGAPQQIFGARGMTTILHKMTIYCAVGFFLTSGVLFGLTADRNRARGSVVQEAVDRGALTSQPAPVVDSEDPLFPAVPPAEEPASETVPPAAGQGEETESSSATDDQGGGTP